MLPKEPDAVAGAMSTREPDPILGLDRALTIARRLALTAAASMLAPALLRIIICAVGFGDILPTFLVLMVMSADFPLMALWLPYLVAPPTSSIDFFY